MAKYNHIFIEGDHTLEQVADFMYYKTFAQVYVYCCLNDIKTLRVIIEELQTIMKFLDHKPILKLNALFLNLVILHTL